MTLLLHRLVHLLRKDWINFLKRFIDSLNNFSPRHLREKADFCRMVQDIVINVSAMSDNYDNLEKYFPPYYRGFPITTGENGHRFGFCRPKYTFFDKKIRKKHFILDIFNLSFVTVITWHSELSTLNFRDSENFLESY